MPGFVLLLTRCRCGQGTGCPKCTHHSSRGELRILSELETLFVDVRSRYKIDGVELDIYIPEFKFGIEFDGAYWHKNRSHKDLEKNCLFQKEGIKILRVREEPLKKLQPNDIIVGKEIQKNDLNLILIALSEMVLDANMNFDDYLHRKIFVNNGQYRNYINSFPDPILQNSLVGELPGLAKFWDQKRNSPLSANQFTRGSKDEVFWICNKGHSFKRRIFTAVRSYEKNPIFCPICNEREYHPSISLSAKRPDLAAEWHPSLNGELQPGNTKYNTYRKVFWICPNNHEYDMPLRKRTVEGRNCPYCSGRRTAPERSLKARFPKIAAEWHPSKNGRSKPEDYTFGSGKKAWWLCSKGHEWESRITDRTTKTSQYKGNCPTCVKNVQ